MKRYLTLPTLIAAAALAGTADAALVYVDFGDKATTGNAGGVQYNDVAIDGNIDGVNVEGSLQVNGAPGTTAPAPLLDTAGAASGWGLEIDSLNSAGNAADNGSLWAGPYPAVLSGIETTALSSMYFFNRAKHLQVTLSGLDNAATYNILVYGGHDQIGTTTNSIVTGVPVTGAGADYTSKTMNTWTNSSEVIQWAGVAPSGGEIVFTLEGGSRESWLNFMSVEEVPEPGSIALLGIGGLMCMRRRTA